MSETLIYIATWLIFPTIMGLYAIRMWLPLTSRLAIDDRAGFIVGALSGVTVFLLSAALALLITRLQTDKMLWLSGSTLFALAIAGGVLRWLSLPWLRSANRQRRLRRVSIAAGACVMVLIMLLR
ncbi:hypothetical protein FJU30_16910 [Affinibrenneria salicis]|uniref:Uncharacterized protein n=1 Tax=Affinibrenneria salicis TaxID=2590031 RepID=A0A5J5FWA4_9GAMM|nr:hypothetical protein [Affinibrenneria salicis]KAA8998098.1 hypothetical protein FJU30_16910 [Affinibrenneria salicis]